MNALIGEEWECDRGLGAQRIVQDAPCPPDNFTKEEGTSAVNITLEAASFPTNPKQLYGDKKVPLQNIPPAALVYLGIALKEGARKYGAYNWREANVETMTYLGAAMRHIAAYLDREEIDPDSGNPHLAHALASLAILVDAIEIEAVIDNRPIAGAAPRLMKEAADASK